MEENANNSARPNGDVHEHCPPEHVQSEMERLIDSHIKHVELEMSSEVESAWLRHRFNEIHPFQDRNGRVAPALSSLIYVRAGWFPLVFRRDICGDYLDRLEAAEGNDLESLIQLFTKIKKQSLLQALNISEKVRRRHEPVRQAIAATGERL